MGLPNAEKPAKLPAEPASKTSFFGHGKARVRVLAAMLLAIAAVALMVLLDLKVANVAWRLAGLFCASILAVGIVLLLPADWRKRLGTGTATFVAAAGVLSVFLASPSTPPPVPAVDAQAMAHYVAEGPFDQQLPQGLLAGRRGRPASATHQPPGSSTRLRYPSRCRRPRCWQALACRSMPKWRCIPARVPPSGAAGNG